MASLFDVLQEKVTVLDFYRYLIFKADTSLMQALTSMLQGQDGIPPRMFKSLIGTGHPEFASSRQQV